MLQQALTPNAAKIATNGPSHGMQNIAKVAALHPK